MRFLHLADLHIGKRVCETPMLEDQRFALEGVLDLARRERVDAILLAGDIYDKSAPGADAVALVDWFLAACSEANVSVVGISGNHDSAERVAYASTLLAHQGIYLSPVFNGRVEHCVLNDEHGPVTFWMVPFVKPATVKPFYPELEIDDYTDAVSAVLNTVRTDPAYREDGRNVVLSHQFVTWSGGETERCESELQLGTLENVDASVYDGFAYVALGHVHGPQRIMRDTIRYSGSLLKYSSSEARREKTVPLVSIDGFGNVTFSLEPIVPLHDLRIIKGDLAHLVSSEVLDSADRNDYVYAVLTDENPPLGYVDTLRDAYPNLMSATFDNTRTRAAGVGDHVAGIAQMKTPLEHFSEFYELVNGAPLDEAQVELVAKTLSEVGGM